MSGLEVCSIFCKYGVHHLTISKHFNGKVTRCAFRIKIGFFIWFASFFSSVPDWDGRFASQNRKMTRTPLLRFVAVCRLLRAVFLFGLRRFPARPGLGRTFCFAKPKNDAHPTSQICHSHCDYMVSLLFIAHLWLFLYCDSL